MESVIIHQGLDVGGLTADGLGCVLQYTQVAVDLVLHSKRETIRVVASVSIRFDAGILSTQVDDGHLRPFLRVNLLGYLRMSPQFQFKFNLSCCATCECTNRRIDPKRGQQPRHGREN